MAKVGQRPRRVEVTAVHMILIILVVADYSRSRVDNS